jgi:type VI secretion system secreted protein VgrG
MDIPPSTSRIRLESPDASWDDVEVSKLRGRERISRLYAWDVEVVAPGELPEDAALGARVDLVFERDALEVRRVHAMIAEIDDLLLTEPGHRRYALRLVPRAHRLAMVETQEMFVDVTVPELIQEKLEKVGLGADLELRLLGKYPKRELVAQYRESDLAFLSRLAEHLGVSFFFQPHDGRERMVFTDHGAGFGVVEAAGLPFRRRGEERELFELELKRRMVPGFYGVHDYNYRTPQVELSSTSEVHDRLGGGVAEYGGHFTTPAEAAALAKARAEELGAKHEVYSGRSDLPDLTAGTRRTVEDHPALGSLDVLIVEVEHEAVQSVGGAPAEPPRYRNAFKAVGTARTYRPPRATPRPRIQGVVSAVVDAGPAMGTRHAYLDEQGRYLVKFLFDTSAEGKQKPSKPVRMAQPHAGAGYGMHFPLTPGTEVLVAFIDGDPDRPIIVGALPNPMTPSPVDNRSPTTNRIKTQSGICMDFVDEAKAR